VTTTVQKQLAVFGQVILVQGLRRSPPSRITRQKNGQLMGDRIGGVKSLGVGER
jgi:hypothetical protein